MPSMVVTLAAVGLARQHGAGFHRPAVDMDDAGAALAGVAADMGPGQIQVFTQEWTSSVRSSTSAETALPFTVNLTVDTVLLPD